MSRFVRIGAVLLLLAGAAVGIWWWQRPVPVEPPLPSAIQDDEVRQAIETARQKVLQQPHSADAWGDLGLVLLAQLFHKDAIFCFMQAARLNPNDPRWPYAQSLVALKLEPEKAVGLLQQTLKAAGEADAWWEYRSVARLQLGEAQLERLNLDEAEKYFREEEARDPTSQRAALGLGQIAWQRGQEAEAAKFLNMARPNQFAKKKATVILAALARSCGDQEAADAYEKELATLRSDPPWPDPFLDKLVDLEVGPRARERLVGRLQQQGRLAEAAEVYLQDIPKHPTMQNYVGAGLYLGQLSQFERALPLLRKGVELDPRSAFAHYCLGFVLYLRAEKLYRKTPDAAELKAWFPEAIEELQRSAELRPDNALAYLWWGRCLKFLGQPEAAIAPLRKGVACNPADFHVQFSLGEALLEAGHKQEAEIYLENARRILPENPLPVRLLESLRQKKQ